MNIDHDVLDKLGRRLGFRVLDGESAPFIAAVATFLRDPAGDIPIYVWQDDGQRHVIVVEEGRLIHVWAHDHSASGRVVSADKVLAVEAVTLNADDWGGNLEWQVLGWRITLVGETLELHADAGRKADQLAEVVRQLRPLF